jgi:Xaa-Pro aminopeptidase
LRDGPSPSLQDIQSQSGVDIIYTITERSQQKTTIVSSTQTIFTNQLSKVTQDYPHLDIQDICPHIEQYRIIKDPYELSHIQTACDITTAGYIKLLQHIHI